MDEKPLPDTGKQRPDGALPAGEAEDAPRRRFEDLPPAAQRALTEAEERRKAARTDEERPKEIGGRGGKDPARFGDWEIDGRAIDF